MQIVDEMRFDADLGRVDRRLLGGQLDDFARDVRFAVFN
jgi:hypothetical protein